LGFAWKQRSQTFKGAAVKVFQHTRLPFYVIFTQLRGKLSDSFERTLLGEKSFPTRLPKNLFGGQVKSRDLKVLMVAATQVPSCIKKEQI